MTHLQKLVVAVCIFISLTAICAAIVTDIQRSRQNTAAIFELDLIEAVYKKECNANCCEWVLPKETYHDSKSCR